MTDNRHREPGERMVDTPRTLPQGGARHPEARGDPGLEIQEPPSQTQGPTHGPHRRTSTGTLRMLPEGADLGSPAEFPAPPHHSRPSPTDGGSSERSAGEASPVRASDATRDPKQRRGVMARLRSIFLWGLLLAGVTAALGAVAAVLLVEHYKSGLPGVDQLRRGYKPPEVTRVLAQDGTLLANVFKERRTVISVAALPAHVKLSFLAAEDASFYEHEGLDYLGLLRALGTNLRAGRTVQGGSTITQQVVKNTLLDSKRSYSRKVRETILARRLEQHLHKDEILGLYLNQIYLGHGRYGIEEAARYYFGKKAVALDLAEAALLAGIVAAPERYSPRRSPVRALERRRFVLRQMLAKGFVTRELYGASHNLPLRLAPTADVESELCPEVVALAKRQLGEVAGDAAASGGYTVRTTIRPAHQTAARQALRGALAQYAERHKLSPPHTARHRRLWGDPFVGRPKRDRIYVGRVVDIHENENTLDVQVGDTVGRVFLIHEDRYNPKHLPASEFARIGAVLRVNVVGDPDGEQRPELRLELGPQGALVAIDPRTREVLALVGSVEALASGLDRATRAHRQPGSAFKPFVYSYALHSRRLTAASLVDASPDPDPDDPDEAPAQQRLTLRMALAKSVNAAAQRVLEEVGAANVVAWARALGIGSRLEPTPSLALGAYEVTPLEIANAYATFASSGVFAPPVVIQGIEGPGGQSLAPVSRPPSRRVMSPELAYLTTGLMQSVVQLGTARRARGLRRPVAGKTGTTNAAKDAWFVGYSTDIVAAVWIGYDDAIPLGPGESGAATALPAWIGFMDSVHKGKPSTRFPRPSSIIVERVDPATGLLARPDQENALAEEFLDGTVPTQMAPEPSDEDVEPHEPPERTSAHPDSSPAESGASNRPLSRIADGPVRRGGRQRPVESKPPDGSTATPPGNDPPPF